MRIRIVQLQSTVDTRSLTQWLRARFPDRFASALDEHISFYLTSRQKSAIRFGFVSQVHLRYLIEYELEYGLIDVNRDGYEGHQLIVDTLQQTHIPPIERIAAIEKIIFYRDMLYE